MPNEVKLLPCEDAITKLARDALRDNVFSTADDKLYRAVESAIYRMHSSEVARCLLRIVAQSRPTIVTDEVVERVAKLVAADQLKRRYGPGWDRLTKYGRAHLKHDVRTVLAAMPAIVGGEGA